jgi:type VI secretion system protein ImpJ
MFLTPQHLQQLDRFRDALNVLLREAAAPYPWGIYRIQVDETALANNQFLLVELQVLMLDGTPLLTPGNLEVASRSCEGLLGDATDRKLVYLGVPDYLPSSPNLADGSGGAVAARFFAAEQDVVDENTGLAERRIQLKRIRGRILFEGEDPQGFQVLPLGRLRPGANMEGVAIDERYVPPVLQLSSWPPLLKAAEGLAAKLASAQASLSRSLAERDLVELCPDARGLELLLKAQPINQGALMLRQLCRTGGVTPFQFYLELLRTIGSLLALKGALQLGKLPMYDHRHLGQCFRAAATVLDKLLGYLSVKNYVQRPFVAGDGLMEVELDQEWREGDRLVFVRVSGAGDYDSVVKKMGSVKFCSPAHFQQLLQRRMQGLQIKWQRRTPSGLPSGEGGIFGEITRSGQFWTGVTQELTLVAGGAEELPYRFDLFVE